MGQILPIQNGQTLFQGHLEAPPLTQFTHIGAEIDFITLSDNEMILSLSRQGGVIK